MFAFNFRTARKRKYSGEIGKMLKQTFLNNGVSVWPPCDLQSRQVEWLGTPIPFQHEVSLGRVRHQAFAVGFFGFHYVRATVENVPSLRKDSLCRLVELLTELQIGGTFIENPDIMVKRPYSEFKETIIKRISLELGDNFSSTVQWMVEFGFDLAAARCLLVAATENNSSSKLKDCLSYLGSRFPQLLLLAQKLKLSEKIVGPLEESWDAVRRRKTKSAARKCCEEMGLVVNSLLTTRTAVKLLN